MHSPPFKTGAGERAKAASITQHLSQVRVMFVGFVTILLTGLFSLSVAIWLFAPGVLEKFARERAQLSYWSQFGAHTPIMADVVQGPARSVPVLLYHGEGSGTNMPIATFVEQLRALKQAGWQTITMRQFESFVAGSTTLPDKSFLLTFDDGRRDTYYSADPVLKDLGYNAVMFVITDFSMPDNGTKPTFYLNESELRYMAESGHWELESHGKDDHLTYHVQSTTDLSLAARTVDGHFLSNKFWRSDANRFENDDEFASRIRSDLTASKQKLEGTFGISVSAFAYPFNDFGEDSVNFPGSRSIIAQQVQNAYQLSFYQTWGSDGDSFNYPDPMRHFMRRIEPLYSWSGNDLISILDAGRAKDIPYQPTSFDRDWQRTWGTIERGASLTLDAAATSSGAGAFLNGTGDWRDYRFDANVQLNASTSVSLLARNRDDESYFECSFSENMVQLEAHHDGVIDILKTEKGPGTPITLAAIKVVGQDASCLIDDAIVITGASDTISPFGGIGVQTWNEKLGDARAELLNIKVTPTANE